MSWQMTSLVKQHFRGSPALKLLAMNLADYADPEGGEVFPSIARLAADTGVSVRTATLYMGTLREMGFLQRVNAGKGGTYTAQSGQRRALTARYRINPDWFKSCPADSAGHGVDALQGHPDTLPKGDACPAAATADKDSIGESSREERARLDVATNASGDVFINRNVSPEEMVEVRARLQALSSSLRLTSGGPHGATAPSGGR